MKAINSYKCSYCGKLYEQKDSCRSHEYKCYFNPATKSCASCAFLRYDNYQYKPKHSIAVRTCMLGKDVAKKLSTKCADHCPKAELNSSFKVSEAEADYRPISFVKKELKRLKLESSGDITVSPNEDVKEIIVDEKYYSIQAEACICKLAGAIGYKLLFFEEIELSKTTDLVSENDFEKYSNLYFDDINDVVLLFSNIGFHKIEIWDLISKVAEKLQMVITTPCFLITECETSYNLKMEEALNVIEDEVGAYYYSQKALKSKEKTNSIEELFDKALNVTISKDAYKDQSKRYFKSCIRSISDVVPDLKEQLTARLEISSNTVESKSMNIEYHDVLF